MNLITCMMTNSSNYKRAGTSIKTGGVVHSTGANNPNLSRYVQPSPDDPNYDKLLKLIGKNEYANSHNQIETDSGVHAWIGKLADGSIATVQVLPYTMSAWGVGRGSKGSYNYEPTARIQFEICEDDLTNEKYFYAVMKEAQEYAAYICGIYKWDAAKWCSHYEAGVAGYGSGHGDPDHWLKKFGKTMSWFRAEVQKILDAQAAGAQKQAATDNTDLQADKEDEFRAMLLQVIREDPQAIYDALGDVKYATLENCPAWMQKEIAPMLEAGIIDGGTTADVNDLDINKRKSELTCIIVAGRLAAAAAKDAMNMKGHWVFVPDPE